MPYVNTVPDPRGPKGLPFREMHEQYFQSSIREPWEGAGLRQARDQPGMKAGVNIVEQPPVPVLAGGPGF